MPRRPTTAQRRVLAAAGPGGLLQREAAIPESTWRGMLNCMWRAGWIEETAEGHRVVPAPMSARPAA